MQDHHIIQDALERKITVHCLTQWFSKVSSKIDQQLITNVSFQVVDAFQKDNFVQLNAPHM